MNFGNSRSIPINVRVEFEIKDSTEVAEASFFSLNKLPTIARSTFSQSKF